MLSWLNESGYKEAEKLKISVWFVKTSMCIPLIIAMVARYWPAGITRYRCILNVVANKNGRVRDGIVLNISI